MLAASYNPLLVLSSLLVAILASYTALDMAGRITTAQGSASRWWLAGGASAMGVGIWSMHFIGMLAFSLPIPLGYDPAITLLSLLIAIASSVFALWLVCQDTLPWKRLILGAILMGLGIASMHYTGMAAMRMIPLIHYIPWLFILSIVIAIVASGAALWIAFHLRRPGSRFRHRAGAGVVMGFAIVGMHYTGMAAAQFSAGSICGAARGGVNTGWLALLVIIVTMAILAIALIISVLDLRLESRTSKLAVSLAEANQELTYLALHDNLTKLPNRALLEDRLKNAIPNANRKKTRFALMFVDLDGFKEVNDAYGHPIGDQLLVEVAKRIGVKIRMQDTISRVGGDEFVFLGEDIGEPADAAMLAQKLLLILREPFQIGGHELRMSASIGIAMYPGNGSNQHELLTNADAAMYHAKSLGRDAYCFFEASMNAHVHAHLEMVQDLRRALDRGELILYYQPKFEAPNGPTVGAEALLRWQHPTRGLIQPDEFIPLAEKTGVILPIGEWVLDEACRQMREWRDAGRQSWTMAVNLSSLQFGHAGLIDTVRSALERHQLEPHCLTLEITESTAMRDADASEVILQQLHEMGVQIAIDDFGTGYSSLLYLKRLPAHELKIDRGFVHNLAHDTEDRAIISAIVALGRTLDLKIVAEGVETAAQQEFLTNLGCNSLQGFLFGKPMPPDEFIAALDAVGT